MRSRVLLLVLASLFFASSACAAEEETRWYGWQTLLVDAAATSLLIASVDAQSGGSKALDLGTGSGKAFLGLGIATYALGGGTVHLAHGSPAKAIASVGMRAVSPVLTSVVGMLVAIPSCGAGGYCALAGGLFGLVGGAVVASIVDVAALAHEPVRPAKPGLSVGFAPTRGGGTAGVSGSF